MRFVTDDTLSELTDIAIMSWFFGISPKEVTEREWEDSALERATDYYERKISVGKALIGKAFVNDIYSFWHDYVPYPEANEEEDI